MKKYTRQEAAVILDCDPQTISNYAAKGYFDTIKTPSTVFVDKKTFDKFVKENYTYVKGVEDVKAACDREVEVYRLAAEAKRADYEEQMRAAETMGLYAGIIGSRVAQEVIVQYLNAICEDKGDKEFVGFRNDLSVVLDACNGLSREEIAKKHGVCVERIRQRTERGLLKLRKSSGYVDGLRAENATLKGEVARLEAEVEVLKKESVKVLKTDKTVQDAKVAAIAKTKLIRLVDCDFSVRALNSLLNVFLNSSVYDLTLADLLEYSKAELLRCRNIGKKSINEFICFVERFAEQNQEYPYELGCFK